MRSSWRCCRGFAGRPPTICGVCRRKERAEAVQEVVASTFVSYVRLIERGKADLAFAGPLARYAACQYLRGRRVGSRHECVRRHAQITASDERSIWSSNSTTSTTRLANGNSWSWKTGIPHQLTLPRHVSIFVPGSSRCPSGPGMLPKPSPRAKRRATLHGCLVARRRGSASFAASSIVVGLLSLAKWLRRHHQLWLDLRCYRASGAGLPAVACTVIGRRRR